VYGGNTAAHLPGDETVTILVGGGQEELGNVLLPFLARRGYAVVFVPNGQELIEQARAQPIDLIIMDLNMPLKDGIRTLDGLKAVPETSAIPVIILAKSTDVKSRTRGEILRQGAAAVLDKPVDLEGLEREIEKVIGAESEQGGCLTDETLGRLADDALPQKEAERAKGHLSRCRSCQEKYDEWKRAEELVRDLFRTAMTIHMEPSKDCLSPWKLTAYFRGALPKYERARLEEHLSRCSYCTRELVALHRLMKEFDEKEPEPLSPETLNRLTSQVRDLVRKGQGDVLERARTEKGKIAETRAQSQDDAQTKKNTKVRCLSTKKAQVAASLVGLTLVLSAAVAGFTAYRHQKTVATARAVSQRTNAISRRAEESGHVALPQVQVEEKIEVFGQVAVFQQKPERFAIPEHVDRIARALIKQHYYDESIAEEALERTDIQDVFDALNRLETEQSKSQFLPKCPNRILSPDELLLLKGELSGRFAGIGICLRRAPDESGMQIIGFAASSPAKEAGLQVGDIITEANGEPLRGLDLAQTTSLIRGPINTTVELKVVRHGVPDFVVPLLRIPSEIIKGQATILEPNTPYMRMYSFLNGAPEYIEDALGQFKEQYCRHLILDLRGNTGGDLKVARDVAELFLPKDAPIYKIGDRSGARIFTSGKSPKWEKPMVVLVDSKTVSAGELVAAVLKDSHRALLVGERTAGKGSVQTAYKVSDNYGIQITTATLSGPNGQTFNNCGVEPDIRAVQTGEKEFLSRVSNIAEDASVKAALEALERS